jgi:hypothetical protein
LNAIPGLWRSGNIQRQLGVPTLRATSAGLKSMRSATSLTAVFFLVEMSVPATHADERKFDWNCSVRGSYSFAVDDAGHGTPSGNPLNGTNRMLFTVKLAGDKEVPRFLLSAYVDNKLTPQMSYKAKQVIEVETDDNGAPENINAAWLGLTGPNSFVVARSSQFWRFVYTGSEVFDDSVVKALPGSGPPGPTVFIETGDCVLNP